MYQNAAVIAIGDELTSGHRIDTNSRWISADLMTVGIPVSLHLVVGDDIDQCVSAIRYAGSRCSLICLTGGLGPTADDITRQALAAATGQPLLLDTAVLARVEAIFLRRGRTMTENNRAQAMFPTGTRVIPNPHGTAPGIDLTACFDQRDVRLIALPGVPAEAQEMFAETVLPRLSQAGGSFPRIRTYTLKCFGPGESELESMLGDLTARGRQPLVGITVHQATISLRILATGRSDEECEAMAAPTLELIRRRLGDIVFGEGDDELQHAVVRCFVQNEYSLAVADAFSRGLLCQWLAECDSAGRVMKGGLVIGSCVEMRRLLQRLRAEKSPRVPDATPESAASERETEMQILASGVRDLWQTDYGLVVGAAVDSDANSTNGAGVLVGLAGPRANAFYHVSAAGHPEIQLARGAKFALNKLRQQYAQLS